MQYSNEWARTLFLWIEEHKEELKPGRGVCLTSQSKHILTSVRSYFEEEKWTGKSLKKNKPLDRTATATGISKTTIKGIYKPMTGDKEILTPTKQYIESYS